MCVFDPKSQHRIKKKSQFVVLLTSVGVSLTITAYAHTTNATNLFIKAPYWMEAVLH